MEVLIENGQHKRLATEDFLRKKYPLEMVLHGSKAAQAIWAMTPKGAELYPEMESELFHIDPEYHGTTDAVIIDPFDTLHVIDYKYGKMPVSPEENPQMISYWLGIAHKFDNNFERAKLTIIQPRSTVEMVRTWETSAEKILKWVDRLKAAISLARKKNAPRKSGEHCFFCPAKNICDEYNPSTRPNLRAQFAGMRSESSKKKQLLLDFGKPKD